MLRRWPLMETLVHGDNVTLLTLNQVDFADNSPHCFFALRSGDSRTDNTFYLAPWKAMELPQVVIEQEVSTRNGQIQVKLKADTPTHFLTLEHPAPGRWSDNSFTLFQGEEKTILWQPAAEADLPENFSERLTINHLRKTYH